MDKPPYSFGENAIHIILDGQPKVIRRGNANFDKVRRALLEEDYDSLQFLLDVRSTVKSFSKGCIEIENESVFYLHPSGEKEELHGAVVQKLISLINQGARDVSPLTNFIERLLGNTSSHSVKQLYNFLEYKELPIDSNGYFIAYKAVTNTYKDKHSGTFDNSIGATPFIERRKVDDNPENHCSYGLHVGSLDYARNFATGDDRIIMVRVDPADAVSVPNDCSFQKLRVTKYTVIGELKDCDFEIGNAVYDEGDEILHKEELEKKYDPEDIKEEDLEKIQIRNYLQNRHEEGIWPTIKQIQSRMKDTDLICSEIIEVCKELGFNVCDSESGKKNSRSKVYP